MIIYLEDIFRAYGRFYAKLRTSSDIVALIKDVCIYKSFDLWMKEDVACWIQIAKVIKVLSY